MNLRRSHDDAAGTELGSSPVERTAVNAITVPVLTLGPREPVRLAGLGPQSADRVGAGRSRRSTPSRGKPGTWGRPAAGSRREGCCDAERSAGEYRRPRGPGTTGARTAGVDGLRAADVPGLPGGVEGFLDDLRASLKDGSFRTLPVRQRLIPKGHGSGKLHSLGTTVADRIARTVVKMVLEPSVELVFHPDSYGYELPVRSPPRLRSDVVGEADPPRCAGGELFAGDEAFGDPAVQGRRREFQFRGGGGGVDDGEELIAVRAGVGVGLVAGDVPVVSQGLYSSGGER